jgi:hypothetical protein
MRALFSMTDLSNPLHSSQGSRLLLFNWSTLFRIIKSFVLVLCPGDGWSARYEDSTSHGCIPVIIMDNTLGPFESQIDYSKFAIRCVGSGWLPTAIQQHLVCARVCMVVRVYSQQSRVFLPLDLELMKTFKIRLPSQLKPVLFTENCFFFLSPCILITPPSPLALIDQPSFHPTWKNKHGLTYLPLLNPGKLRTAREPIASISSPCSHPAHRIGEHHLDRLVDTLKAVSAASLAEMQAQLANAWMRCVNKPLAELQAHLANAWMRRMNKPNDCV